MLSKELKELVKSYKLIFMPLVFAMLGLTQPLSMKMLPTLMKSASNLPPGAKIEIPMPAPGVVVAGAFGSFSQMGVLFLVLVVMGAIAGERASGVAATVLTKPVGRGGYMAAKAIAFFLLAAVSLLFGIGAAAYYTDVLIGPVDWALVAKAGALYLPNMLLVVALALSFSAVLPSSVAAGGAAIVGMMVLSMVPKYLGDFLASVNPGRLTESATAVLSGGEYIVGRPVAGVLVLTLVVLLCSWQVFERQEI